MNYDMSRLMLEIQHLEAQASLQNSRARLLTAETESSKHEEATRSLRLTMEQLRTTALESTTQRASLATDLKSDKK